MTEQTSTTYPEIKRLDDEKEVPQVVEKEKMPPIEGVWAAHTIKSDEYATELDNEGTPMLYGWNREEKCWQILTQIDLQARVTRWINIHYPKRYSVNSVDSCVEITTTHVYTYGRRLVRNDDEFKISTRNHILEVQKDGKIIVVDKTENASTVKKYFCRTHINIDLGQQGTYYVPRKTKEIENDGLFSKLITSAIPDATERAIFQEFFGDTLNPALRKCFPVMIGEPNGGKSQLILLLLNLHTNSCTIDITQDNGFSYESVLGKSFIAMDELGSKPNTQMIKQLCGGAVMPIQRKWKTPVSIKPNFKFFAGDNGEFRFNEKSGAIEARMYFFKICAVPVKDRVDEIGKKICQNEMRNVLDWALNGAIEVVKRGRMKRHDELPASSQLLMQSLKEDTNPCIEFIQDLGIEYDKDNLIPKQDVYDHFRLWCEKTGRTGYARTSCPVFVRDLWHKGVENCLKGYDSTLERRAQININGSKKRVECFPVKITNAPELRVYTVDSGEVKSSYNDASAYNPNKLPKHILEKVEKDIKVIEEIVKLNEEQKVKFVERRMLEDGWMKDADGWSKGDQSIEF